MGEVGEVVVSPTRIGAGAAAGVDTVAAQAADSRILRTRETVLVWSGMVQANWRREVGRIRWRCCPVCSLVPSSRLSADVNHRPPNRIPGSAFLYALRSYKPGRTALLHGVWTPAQCDARGDAGKG